MSDNNDVSAEKKKPQQQSRFQRRMSRYFRVGYATIAAALPIISFALTITSLVSANWGFQPLNADETRWIDISPVNGNCTCDSTHVSYCAETSDAFEGTAYLSIVVIGSQLLVALIYAHELGSYGLYGGSHAYTRVILIAALLGLSTVILSVISWQSTFAVEHCGDPSFKTNGAALGWPFFVRCVEMAIMLFFVLYVTSLFPKTNRGPPSIPMVSICLVLMVTSITTFMRGWMTVGDVQYSPWSACTCGTVCSGMATMMSLALGCGAVATLTGFVTIFFMSLRAVDNEGATLKFATIASAVTLLFQLLVVVGWMVAFSGGCGSSLAGDYKQNWPAYFSIGAVASQLVFLIMNLVYMSSLCTGATTEAAAASGDAPAGAAAAVETKSFFQANWWDHLKDPRTLAHEAREEDEGDDELSESDNDEDEDAAAVDKARSGGNVEDEEGSVKK